MGVGQGRATTLLAALEFQHAQGSESTRCAGLKRPNNEYGVDVGMFMAEGEVERDYCLDEGICRGGFMNER